MQYWKPKVVFNILKPNDTDCLKLQLIKYLIYCQTNSTNNLLQLQSRKTRIERLSKQIF